MRVYLGGSPEPRSVALSYTITAHDASTAKEDVNESLARGYRHFNFKVALGGGVALDIAVGDAVRRAASPEAFVWADANQGYRLQEARAAAEGFKTAGGDLLEQPFPADQLPLLRQLRAGTTLPLAVDESTVGPADFLTYVRATGGGLSRHQGCPQRRPLAHARPDRHRRGRRTALLSQRPHRDSAL